MVCVTHGICIRCHKPGYFTWKENVCSECAEAENEEIIKDHINTLKEMSLEERVERIERILFTQSKEIRQMSLHHMTF